MEMADENFVRVKEFLDAGQDAVFQRMWIKDENQRTISDVSRKDN